MKRLVDKIKMQLAPWLAARVIRLIYRRLKPELVNAEVLYDIWASGQHVILAFWHDQLLLMPPVYKGVAVKVLISPSRDGEMIARTIAHFGMGAVRGSSSRGGSEALREMIALADEAIDLGITPDGPKGPRHQVKFGALQLARATGRPIIPIAFACSHGHRFASWDRFLLPYPWGKGVYRAGTPLYAEEGEPAEKFRDRVQAAMDDNTREAMGFLRRYDLSAV